MKQISVIIIISVLIYAYTGCSSTPSCISIAPPEINITGEKTVIERQIVGEYRELERDAWVVSSVKTSTDKSKAGKKPAGGDRQLFMAMKVRDFHLEKINLYKAEGAIGEMNTGFIKYMETARYKNDRESKKILMSVIKNENDARTTIFTRSFIVLRKKEPTPNEINAFGRLFAEEQRAMAQKNDWIQAKTGTWGKK